MDKARVLFVCLGNICRSPMAEAVLRDEIKKQGLSELVEIDSAGTGDWHIGHPPHEGTRKVLEQNGISYEGMRARKFTEADAGQFEYIVCMDTTNERDVRAIIGENDGDKVFRFMDLLPHEHTKDVPDPYYTNNFDYVFGLVKEGCDKLITQIKIDLGLLE